MAQARRAKLDHRAGDQLRDLPIDRMSRRDVAMLEIKSHGLAIDLAVERLVGDQRFELRAEQQRLAVSPIIERLFAHSIAGQRQRLVVPVPNRDGEHADGPLGAGRNPQASIPASSTSVSEWPRKTAGLPPSWRS